MLIAPSSARPGPTRAFRGLVAETVRVTLSGHSGAASWWHVQNGLDFSQVTACVGAPAAWLPARARSCQATPWIARAAFPPHTVCVLTQFAHFRFTLRCIRSVSKGARVCVRQARCARTLSCVRVHLPFVQAFDTEGLCSR